MTYTTYDIRNRRSKKISFESKRQRFQRLCKATRSEFISKGPGVILIFPRLQKGWCGIFFSLEREEMKRGGARASCRKWSSGLSLALAWGTDLDKTIFAQTKTIFPLA
ncbi:hypothetical protein TNCV_35791 [Trichonephila clavipes]|nr:hypothetical protein TNCV_35791 [Trichonephila clavipes]